uniref:Uncharacterized protein n=1 Tax=Onchocerca volvulus TaxID=6282 RepID=A0A2K6VZX2_ONCVO
MTLGKLLSMRNCNNIYLIFIICCISISEVKMSRRHMHNHDTDETPLHIDQNDHKLGDLLSLRTDDMITERDKVMDIRKGDHLTIDSDNH